VYQEKCGDILKLNINGELKEYRLITKIDFSSDRKRMTVIYRDLATNKLFLYCKGADSVILKRLNENISLELFEKTKEDLKHFSQNGLRTLAVGYKEIDEDDFLKWNERYNSAKLDEYNILSEEDPTVKLREVIIVVFLFKVISLKMNWRIISFCWEPLA